MRSMIFSGGMTLEFLLIKKGEMMFTDSFARRAELYIPERDKYLSFLAVEEGVEK